MIHNFIPYQRIPVRSICAFKEKRSQRHEQMVLLLFSFLQLGLFNAAALFDAWMADFYPSAMRFQIVPDSFLRLKVDRRPLFGFSILRDRPKHFDEL